MFLLFNMNQNKVSSSGKMMSAGRSLTIGGPDKLLPYTPEKIVKSKSYNQSVPLMVGITKHDGSYVAAGSMFCNITCMNTFKMVANFLAIAL